LRGAAPRTESDRRGTASARGTRGPYVLYAAVMVVLGFSLVAAIRAAPTTAGTVSAGDRQEELIQVIQDLEARRDSLEQSLASLRLEIAGLDRRAASSKGLAAEFAVQTERLSMAAGLLPVEGPGLQITIADNPRPQERDLDAEGAIVHDYDLRALVNALWLGGAEAVSVGGERLTQFSAIRCVGATILVNTTRVASPFVIEAIGDPEILGAALQAEPESRALITDYVKRYGLKLSVQKSQRLEIPAYRGRLAPRELKPVDET